MFSFFPPDLCILKTLRKYVLYLRTIFIVSCISPAGCIRYDGKSLDGLPFGNRELHFSVPSPFPSTACPMTDLTGTPPKVVSGEDDDVIGNSLPIALTVLHILA